MNTGFSRERHMNRMMKKRTRSTNRLIMQWTPGGGFVGVFFWLVFLYISAIKLLYIIIREARENAELVKHRTERPKIQQQFADLKRGLSVVTDDEWENIPEVGNLTRKKRRRDERSFVVPDSVIVGDRSQNEYENSLDARQQQVGCSYSVVCLALLISYCVPRQEDSRHPLNLPISLRSVKLGIKFCPSNSIRYYFWIFRQTIPA